MNDPRVFFAAERTLLAWMRTALACIGLGFVVARFGLFIRAIANTASHVNSPVSLVLGVGLVLLGALMVGGAAWQHARFCRALPTIARPPNYWAGFGLLMAMLICGMGIALAVYLSMGHAGPSHDDILCRMPKTITGPAESEGLANFRGRRRRPSLMGP